MYKLYGCIVHKEEHRHHPSSYLPLNHTEGLIYPLSLVSLSYTSLKLSLPTLLHFQHSSFTLSLLQKIKKSKIINMDTPLTNNFQPIIEGLMNTGLNDEQILKSLKDNYSINISQRTLTHKRSEWQLTRHTKTTLTTLKDCILRYHNEGHHISKMHHLLQTRHQYSHSERSLKRKLKEMNLTRRKDDIDNNKTDIQNIVDKIKELQETSEGASAGQRRMKLILQRDYGLNIHWCV